MKFAVKIFLIIALCGGLYYLSTLTFNKENEIDNRIVIALDSGHSTETLGGQGIVNESDVNKMATEKLRILLEEDGRFKVILTGDYEKEISLADRRATADLKEVEILISIHANTSYYSYVSGFEIYAQVPENPLYNDSYKLASLVKDNYLAANHVPRKETGIFYLRFEEQANGEYTRYTLTEEEEKTLGFTGETFGILKSELYPSILVEQGFVTNQSDVDNWLSDEGTSVTADILYKSICQYFELT